jgi:predicted membrane metal-binding protein
LLDRRLRPLWEADPLRIQSERMVVAVLRSVGRQVAGVVSLTLVAWVVSTPITACWFGRFTFAALPANLVIVPMSALIMLSGCLALVLGHVWMGFADIYNNASVGLLEVMLWILRWLQRMPSGNIEVAPWSAWMVAAWYAVIACWLWLEQLKQDGQAAVGSGTMPRNSQTRAEVQ